MSAIGSFYSSIKPGSSSDVSERAKLSEIDASMKWPALLFLVSAALWLLAGTFFAMVTAIKMTNPAYLADVEWLTFGHIRSAHLNAVIYGWSFNAAFAVGLWIMARLCHSRIRHTAILMVAGCFWNIGVSIGIFGIFAGDMTSVEWLEMPTYITPLIAFAFALIGVWAVIAFRFRQSSPVYVSQWYILAAIFWFPWLYSIAQIMILFEPARGTVQALTNWWYAHNLVGLWLTPIGLASAYYFIPKVLGVPIHSYYLSFIGFWALAFFSSWAGASHLIGGPVPAWVISVGVVASVMMILPVVVTAMNHHMTVRGRWNQVWISPTLRFVVFGAISYTLVSVTGAAMALRQVSEITHFTHFTVGHTHQGVYAFFTMIMFGAVYYIMPRLLEREWPSAMLIRTHFWCCASGITLMIVSLMVGGWIQGTQMIALKPVPVVVTENAATPTNAEQPKASTEQVTTTATSATHSAAVQTAPDQEVKLLPKYEFIEVVRNTIPWLHLRSMSGILLMVGHLAFAINFFWMAVKPKEQRDREGKPTLLVEENTQSVSAK
ncbi:MAG: cbb3-type cytochrome c oxidase subunit I [Verrucomicrobiota bacterium]|nr:cbb3-type cytochrome c oxidase subunit I [Verrucomicrobiota bacterium]